MKHAEEAGYWFPVQASEYASMIDNLFMAIFWISTFFFVIIVAVMCYFVVRYRRQPGVKPEPSASHNTTLEILWSVLPSIILVWIFYEGARGFLEQRADPQSAEEIRVEAYQFGWQFIYPDGDISSELHVVQGRPTKLIMQSRDVLHSFYVAAFRQKMDVVPGRYTYCFLMPTKVGEYRLSCTEYCGDNHSRMRTLCVVHPTEDDRKQTTQWISPDHSPWTNGERLYKIHCAGCHNINGEKSTGPALNLTWEADRKFIDGSSMKIDENYIRESILQPQAKIVEGFGPTSKMQTFQGKLSDTEINYLISFIKLKDEMANPPADLGTDAVATEEGD
ncbi:MAG: cytochrome c oxidase subunit II, partial [Pirellulaceae bacterium]